MRSILQVVTQKPLCNVLFQSPDVRDTNPISFVIISIYKNNSLKKMSTLHHEEILEDCLIEAEENFRVHNKLTQKQLDELIVRSEGVRLAIEKSAQRLFDTRCI